MLRLPAARATVPRLWNSSLLAQRIAQRLEVLGEGQFGRGASPFARLGQPARPAVAVPEALTEQVAAPHVNAL